MLVARAPPATKAKAAATPDNSRTILKTTKSDVSAEITSESTQAAALIRMMLNMPKRLIMAFAPSAPAR
jgi:hypothetical protein